MHTSKLSISGERGKTQVTRGGGEKRRLSSPPFRSSVSPANGEFACRLLRKIVNVFGRISVICWIVFYVMVAKGEVPHLDSNVYLFSKRRKDQISLKQHRLQSGYLQPLLVQWDLHTTNFYHNEVFPPVTVKNIENNQDKRNPVNPFVILRYRCIQRIQEASIIQKYACIFLIYLENEEESQSTNQLPGMSEQGSRIQMWHSAIKGRWS